MVLTKFRVNTLCTNFLCAKLKERTKIWQYNWNRWTWDDYGQLKLQRTLIGWNKSRTSKRTTIFSDITSGL